jgi:hypothetical protein
MRVSGSPQHTFRPEPIVVDPGNGCDGDARRGERRVERVGEREALERIVRGPGQVEITAEPAGAQMRVGRTDLPVVTGREVRLVGVRVADRGKHAYLALPVQLGERRERRVPVQGRVFRERLSGLGSECEVRTKPGVLGVTGGVEHRKRVGSAVEEDGDEHRVGRGGGPGDALLEEPERKLARAVHRERQAG